MFINLGPLMPYYYVQASRLIRPTICIPECVGKASTGLPPFHFVPDVDFFSLLFSCPFDHLVCCIFVHSFASSVYLPTGWIVSNKPFPFIITLVIGILFLFRSTAPISFIQQRSSPVNFLGYHHAFYQLFSGVSWRLESCSRS